MYKFNSEELDNLINNFADLFMYDYVSSAYAVPEGRGLTIQYYNSPCRKSFTVELSYDKSTELEDIADIIINAYKERLN